MLQKIFRRGRNSLIRSSTNKDENNTKTNNSNTTTRLSFKRPKLFHSKSLDESTLSCATRSNTPPPPTTLSETEHSHQNGNSIRKAPLAGKDDSFDGGGGCGDDSSRKVHFISPNGTLDNLTDGGGAVDEKLFDDGMMKAFEVGNLSIQEFLESPHTSPDTTPDTTLIKKSRDLISSCSGSDLARSKSLPVSPAKKPSLLDQAHAKAGGGSKTARLPTASPVQGRDKIRMRKCNTDDADGDCGKSSNGKPVLKKSHRFSKSLEHLAQQVFGETEFERQLEKATELLAKVPIVAEQGEGIQEDECLVENAILDSSLPISTSKDIEIVEKSTVNCPKSEPVNRKLLGVGGLAPKRRTIQRCQSAVQQSELRVGSSGHQHHNQKHEMTKSVDFPSPDTDGNTNHHDKLESWVNKLDLSSSRASSINADSTANLRGPGTGSTRTMDPVIEGVPLQSPCKLTATEYPYTVAESSDAMGKDRQRAKSEGCVGTAPLTANLLQQRFRHDAKLVKSDSNAATCGSDIDLNASVNSILDLNFPPPPPVVDLKDNVGAVDGSEGVSSKHEVQGHTIPFDWEVLSSDGCELGSSQDYIESHPLLPSSDPLTDSLFSVVPLPEDPTQLRPALTRALSEIVSEIIGARHKLNRILGAIEIHQQILKDQSKQINAQTHQIAELRFAHLELTSFSTVASENGGVKLRPKMSRNYSTNSSIVENKNTTDKKSNLVRRRPQSARTYRQSREMADLSNTLDSLIDQCSEMQTSPRSVATTSAARKAAFLKFRISANTRNPSPSSSSSSAVVKRSNTFPSREHVPTLKRIEGSNDYDC